MDKKEKREKRREEERRGEKRRGEERVNGARTVEKGESYYGGLRRANERAAELKDEVVEGFENNKKDCEASSPEGSRGSLQQALSSSGKRSCRDNLLKDNWNRWLRGLPPHRCHLRELRKVRRVLPKCPRYD